MQEFFESFGIEQWLTLVSAGLAIFSFFLNLHLVARQEKRNRVSMKMAHDSDVIGWSDEVVTLLAYAQEMLVEKGVSYNDADFRARRSDVRARLSALIDRGRLFFPNRKHGDYGMDKEPGFQGRRHKALAQAQGAGRARPCLWRDRRRGGRARPRPRDQRQAHRTPPQIHGRDIHVR